MAKSKLVVVEGVLAEILCRFAGAVAKPQTQLLASDFADLASEPGVSVLELEVRLALTMNALDLVSMLEGGVEIVVVASKLKMEVVVEQVLEQLEGYQRLQRLLEALQVLLGVDRFRLGVF